MQGPPGYQDPDVPDVGMPGDDDDTPDLGGAGSGSLPPAPGAPGYPGQQPPPDLPLQYGSGGFPPHYPGGGTLIPVPDNAEPAVAVIPDGGDDDDDDHPPYAMEVHVEPLPPEGPPDAPGAKVHAAAIACSRVSACCSDSETSEFSDPEGYASSVTTECTADAIHGRAS